MGLSQSSMDPSWNFVEFDRVDHNQNFVEFDKVNSDWNLTESVTIKIWLNLAKFDRVNLWPNFGQVIPNLNSIEINRVSLDKNLADFDQVDPTLNSTEFGRVSPNLNLAKYKTILHLVTTKVCVPDQNSIEFNQGLWPKPRNLAECKIILIFFC